MRNGKTLVYREDILEQLERDRFLIGVIGMIHAKSAVNSVPAVDPREVSGYFNESVQDSERSNNNGC